MKAIVTATSDQVPRNAAFDGLRGIAAISVVMLHLKATGLYPFPGENHAVDLFFVLSGFVVAQAYDDRIVRDGVIPFMRLRLERLYPLYAVSLLVVPAFSLFIAAISRDHAIDPAVWISLPFQALYLPSPPMIVPHDRPAFLLNGPGWSLFWELAINLGYAMLLPKLSSRVLVTVATLAGLAAIDLALSGISTEAGSDWPTFYIGGVRVLFGFSIGVLIYRAPRSRLALGFAPLALLALSTLFLPGAISMLVAMPLIVWLAAAYSGESKSLSRLGWLSYPLYAIHLPLFSWVFWLAGRQLHLAPLAQGAACLLVALIAAWILALGDDRVQGWFKGRREVRTLLAGHRPPRRSSPTNR
jgi:peptidoglycan/LPS O-acetylase OafA/YrhL